MTVKDYPVTLPYGSTAPPYDATHKHRGRDYGCPTGTPLVVAGQQIGLSGATGKVIGAHCHIQEWNGGYANTREPNNAFQGGTVVNIDPAGTQGDGSFGKFITIRTADGWNDTYCHLSRIDVKIGDVIGAPMSVVGDGDTYNYFTALFDRAPDQAELDKNRGKEWNAPDPKLRAPLYDDMIGRGRYLTEENKRLQKLVDDSQGKFKPLGQEVFVRE